MKECIVCGHELERQACYRSHGKVYETEYECPNCLTKISYYPNEIFVNSNNTRKIYRKKAESYE